MDFANVYVADEDTHAAEVIIGDYEVGANLSDGK